MGYIIKWETVDSDYCWHAPEFKLTSFNHQETTLSMLRFLEMVQVLSFFFFFLKTGTLLITVRFQL